VHINLTPRPSFVHGVNSVKRYHIMISSSRWREVIFGLLYLDDGGLKLLKRAGAVYQSTNITSLKTWNLYIIAMRNSNFVLPEKETSSE